ncbi:hypothetical protein B0H19DRAFT_1125154 [Mycena capillaripes]|nr:hypothetical protein B0H19DRAFT_1125154 [Mycena capillaripes]
MTTGTGGKKKRKGKPDILSPQAPPGPPAKLDIIKVDRPRPKPLYRGKTTSTTVDTPMPAAPPLETSSQNYTLAPVQGSPRTVKKPDYTTRHTKQRDTPKKALPSLYKFLAKCDPPMEHLAAGFKDAGFKDGMDLVGMAKWKDERQRKFLSDTTKIARTALEVEAIVIGLSGLLLESSLVISAAN